MAENHPQDSGVVILCAPMRSESGYSTHAAHGEWGVIALQHSACAGFCHVVVGSRLLLQCPQRLFANGSALHKKGTGLR